MYSNVIFLRTLVFSIDFSLPDETYCMSLYCTSMYYIHVLLSNNHYAQNPSVTLFDILAFHFCGLWFLYLDCTSILPFCYFHCLYNHNTKKKGKSLQSSMERIVNQNMEIHCLYNHNTQCISIFFVDYSFHTAVSFPV